MTIQTVPRAYLPDWRAGRANSTSLTTSLQTAATLDGATDAWCWVGDAPATGNLTDIYFRTVTVQVTSGPLNFDARVETVSNGRPSGTLHDTNSNAAVSIADTDDNVWKSVTLTAAAVVTRGGLIAIRLNAPGSGTFSVTLAGAPANGGLIPVCANFPIAAVDTDGNGVFDAAIVGSSPCLAVKISGVIYQLEGCCPWDSLTVAAFNSGSSPDEKALRIQDPVPRRVIGMEALISNVVAAGDFTFSLWLDTGLTQTDADALAQASLDGDAVVSTTQDGWVQMFFETAVTLAAGSTYWAGVRADTANNISLLVTGLPSGILGIGSATPGGAACYFGSRAWAAGSAGVFGTDGASVPWIRLIYDGLDDGAGAGGGMLRHPGMNGGLNA